MTCTPPFRSALCSYFNSLRNGFVTLVTSSIVGSLLGAMLFMPGLSMITGGIKYKNQTFNRTSAGVSSVLLIVSIVGPFSNVFIHVFCRF
jgi:Ca2+:H+ antiporter